MLSHPNGLTKFKNNLLEDQEIDEIVKCFCIHPEYLWIFDEFNYRILPVCNDVTKKKKVDGS